jgi:hypothetical protein
MAFCFPLVFCIIIAVKDPLPSQNVFLSAPYSAWCLNFGQSELSPTWEHFFIFFQ